MIIKLTKHCLQRREHYEKEDPELIKYIFSEVTKNIDSSIEEIEYAIAKPQYAQTYLNNAIRFLKESNSNKTLSLIAEEHDELVNEIQKLRKELEEHK